MQNTLYHIPAVFACYYTIGSVIVSHNTIKYEHMFVLSARCSGGEIGPARSCYGLFYHFLCIQQSYDPILLCVCYTSMESESMGASPIEVAHAPTVNSVRHEGITLR